MGKPVEKSGSLDPEVLSSMLGLEKALGSGRLRTGLFRAWGDMQGCVGLSHSISVLLSRPLPCFRRGMDLWTMRGLEQPLGQKTEAW